MNAAVGDKYTSELIKLFEREGPSLYDGHHSLCLTVPCLHYLQRKFTTLQESAGEPIPTQFVKFQQLQDSLGRILSLKLISDRRFPLAPTATLNLAPFKALQTLILKKVPLQLVTGLQRLRNQLKTLVIQRCYVEGIDDVIVKCGGDDSTSFAWTKLRELDLSHNTIAQLGDSLVNEVLRQYLPGLEKVSFSNNVIKESTEGIQCVDSVTLLHLGFNQLQSVPRFGSRAKYNLTTLNLRNNCLKNIEGVEELDSLVELDLTDNLLSKHSTLKPLQNLHHLTVLVLVGNPLVFHHKHRLKTAENLSNLVNQSMFRLDGKKLSSAEKKAIPRSLTHYSTVPPPPTTSLPPLLLTGAVGVPVEDGRVGVGDVMSRLAVSVPISAQTETIIGKKHRKKTRTVNLSDSDEEKQKARINSYVPLINAQPLRRQEELRNQLQENWLLSTNSVNTSSTTTTTDDYSATKGMGKNTNHPPSKHHKKTRTINLSDSDGGKQKARIGDYSSAMGVDRSASHPPPTSDQKAVTSSVKQKGSNTTERHRRHSQPDRKWSIGGGKGRKGRRRDREEKEEPLHSSTPVERVSTPSSVSGDFFLVERYESDVEEEAEQVFITLTDRFLEERSTQGKTLDRLALHCLQTASIEHRQWKGRGGEQSNQSEVLVLQFSHERRDRRKREYVLTEEGDHQMLLELLMPIVETNQATLLVGSRVECLKCQQVFDTTQAIDQPSDEPQPLSTSFSSRRRSLSKLMCPYCKSQLLQYSTTKSFKSGLVSSHSPKTTTSTEPMATVVTSKGNVRSGFSVGGANLSLSPHTAISSPAPIPSSTVYSTGSSHSSANKGSLDGGIPYSTELPSGEHSIGLHYDVSTGSFGSLPNDRENGEDPGSRNMASSPRGYSSPQRLASSQQRGSPEDILYPFDSVDLEGSRTSALVGKEAGSAGQTNAELRLTSSEPTTSTQSTLGTVRTMASSPTRVGENRRHSSGLEDQMKPWNFQRKSKSLNPFDQEYRNITQKYGEGSIPESQVGEYSFQVPEERYGAAAMPAKQQRKEFGEQVIEEQCDVTAASKMGLEEQDIEKQKQYGIVASQLESVDEQRGHYSVSGKVEDGCDERCEEGWSEPNPFEERCSTNPFDFEPDLSMEVEGDVERRGEGEEMWWAAEDFPPGGSDQKPSSKKDVAPNDFDDLCLQIPEVKVSTSVPSRTEVGSYMRQAREREKESKKGRVSNRQTLTEMPENLGHNRSKSMDYHPGKIRRITTGHSEPKHASRPPTHPASKKRSSDERSQRGSNPASKASSLKSSACSLDSNGSPPTSKVDTGRGYSSGEKHGKSRYPHNSSEKVTKGYSSGERERLPRGWYNSNEKLSKGYSSGEREKLSRNAYSSSEKLTKGYSSGEREKCSRGGYSSSEKVTKGYSSGERERHSRGARGYSSGEKTPGLVSNRKPSSGSDRHGSSGSWNGGRRKPSSASEKGKSEAVKRSPSLKSSSGSLGRKLHSTSILFRDEDPSYVHNSFNLHLDMEVFNTDAGEHFKMIFKSPVVQYGHSKEVSSLVVISNLCAYIYHITAPESHHPSKWLQLMATHPLEKLVYIDIGVGYQYLRVEFNLPGACYTFLTRDEDKCTICATKLAIVVSDTPGSSFRTVGVCPFSVRTLQYPDRRLREIILTRYEKLSGRRTPTHSQQQWREVVEDGEVEGEKVTLYLLAHRFLSRNGQGQVPITVVLTKSHVFLASENFQQWPLPRLQELPPREVLRPPFSDIHCKDITDIEQIKLDRDQSSHVVLRFFKENVSEGEFRHWILILQNADCVRKLVSCIQKPWEALFETTLPICYD